MIIVDSREPKEIVDKLKREVQVQVMDIQWVDYLVCHDEYAIPVERKTASDFVQSIIDGRIFNQAYMMSTFSPISYIIVEGVISEALMEHRFPRRAYLGALASLALKRSPYGERGQISIVNLETMYDTIEFLILLNRQLLENKDRLPRLRVRGKRYIDKKGCMIAMLQAIPGVGEERARQIAEKINSIKELIEKDPITLSTLTGISINLARKIKEYLT